MTDLTDAERAWIEEMYAAPVIQLGAIYRAGLAAGNKERDQMLAVIEAAKAMRMDSPHISDRLLRSFDAALEELEGNP